MFTGLIEAIGAIETVMPLGDASAGVRLTIHAGTLELEDVAIGDSISVQGACMTVTGIHGGQRFSVEVSRESLDRTTGLDKPGEVNLEKALRAHDRIGGHWVSGHVDGLGAVTHFAPVGESHQLRLLAPRALSGMLAEKGSIAVNGVSLTLNAIHDGADGCACTLNLIAHTLRATTLKHLTVGAPVNLEVDLVARYVARMLEPFIKSIG